MNDSVYYNLIPFSNVPSLMTSLFQFLSMSIPYNYATLHQSHKWLCFQYLFVNQFMLRSVNVV